jgi:hypothetical protein
MSFAVVNRPETRSRLVQLYLEQLCQVGALMAQAHELALRFLSLVREQRGEGLEAWRAQAADSDIEPLCCFAAGLQDELMAIEAGLTLPWSNGVTEGSGEPSETAQASGLWPCPCGAAAPADSARNLTDGVFWVNDPGEAHGQVYPEAGNTVFCRTGE